MDAALGDNQSLQCIVKLVLCPPVLKSKSQNRPAADMATAMPTAHKAKAESMIWKSPKARSWSSFGRQVSRQPQNQQLGIAKHICWMSNHHLAGGWPLRMDKSSSHLILAWLPSCQKANRLSPPKVQSCDKWIQMIQLYAITSNVFSCSRGSLWMLNTTHRWIQVNAYKYNLLYSEFKDGTS